MESKIAKSIQLKHQPVALIWSDQKPEDVMEFKEGKWGCVMWLVASAAKGKAAICDRKTFGCFGGGVGMGFGNRYQNFPGGVDCFCHFLSSGNEAWEKGQRFAEKAKRHMRDEFYDNFVHGERYLKSPEQVRKFVASLPMTAIPAAYVLFKPLQDVREEEEPVVIIFFADPDQLSALVVLANYSRDDNENVIIPHAAGCHTVGIYPYREAKAQKQRAVVGLTDISARAYVGKQLGANLMTFAVPLKMYEEMEHDVDGSFLERPVWQSLLKGKVAR